MEIIACKKEEAQASKSMSMKEGNYSYMVTGAEFFVLPGAGPGPGSGPRPVSELVLVPESVIPPFEKPDSTF